MSDIPTRLILRRLRTSSILCAAALLTGTGCEQTPNAHPLAPDGLGAARNLPTGSSAAVRHDAPGRAAVSIHHGTIVFATPLTGDWEGPLVAVQGTSGFRANGAASAGQNATGTFFSPHCLDIVGCPAGETIPFSATWSGSDFVATVRSRGITYEHVNSLASDAGLLLQVTGVLTFPAFDGTSTATTSAPFALTGTFSVPEEDVGIHGQGLATFELEWSAADQRWYVVRVHLQFAPN